MTLVIMAFFIYALVGIEEIGLEIEDPFGGSVEIYKKTRDSINQAILELIRFLELGDN